MLIAVRVGQTRSYTLCIVLFVLSLTILNANPLLAVPLSQTPSQSTPWPTIDLQQIPGTFHFPVYVTHAGDGTDRLFVVEKAGKIWIVEGEEILSTSFLDISDRVESACQECGLLGMAFPPDYADTGYFIVHYTSKEDLVEPEETDAPDEGHDTVIARFHTTTNPNVADPLQEEMILTFHQPYPEHNGGQIAFGLDGFLYIGLGDGGSNGDPFDNGQETGTLLGKILRIDVGKTGPYSIPADNPFVALQDFRPEIWAYGLRNPWRFSFDRLTGDFYVGDVGQYHYEEINYHPFDSPSGQNYGWRIMEGTHCYAVGKCEIDGLQLPIAEYSHADGDCSVIGGYVARNSRDLGMAGIYFYTDLCSGKIWGLQREDDGWVSKMLLETEMNITSFGEDEAGNLYVTNWNHVYRILDLEWYENTKTEFLPSILHQVLVGS